MKYLLLVTALLALPFVTGGCASPAYSGGFAPRYVTQVEPAPTGEKSARIVRNIHWEMKMITDDVVNILMLDPVSHQSIWAIR